MPVKTWGSLFYILVFTKKQMNEFLLHCFLLFLLFKQSTLKSLSGSRIYTLHQWNYSSRKVLVNEEVPPLLDGRGKTAEIGPIEVAIIDSKQSI